MKKSLQNLLAQKATYWRQRGKIRNCVLGDENTSYYHMCATIRLRKNQIKTVMVNGIAVSSHSGKHLALHSFYKQLLGTSNTCALLSGLPLMFQLCSLDSFQSAQLVRPFSLPEIRSALFAMCDSSSPGPDGFGPAFFKQNWNLVRNDL